MAIPTSTVTYGKLVPAYAKQDMTLKTSKSIGMKYPLVASPGKGFFSKSSGLDLVKSAIKAVIRTERGERFMLPDFGCSLRRFLMEPVDEATFHAIRDEVRVSFSRYLKSVKVTKLRVLETRTGGIKVSLFCALKENELVNFKIDLEV
tara:strand:+ start:47338 stop:47781 length:444 start_codon:yes stop_codon:yes gene_type:complete